MRRSRYALILSALLFANLACAASSSAAEDAIAARMQKFVEARQLSGAVTLVAHKGKVVHLEAVGMADIEARRMMKEDAIFAIASMTKPITATALMMLQDEGKLSIEDPIAKYIPAFKKISLKDAPPQRDLKIRDVMTHTSGLGGEQKCINSLQETVDELATRTLSFQPGTQWKYSPGLNVCGRIIEIVSGQSYAEFLAERILEPLQMVDTTFSPTPDQKKRIARLYQPGEDKKSLAPGSHRLTDSPGSGVPNPSGGLFSTASDLAKFYQMILNGGEVDGNRIVSREAVAAMTTVQTGDIVTGFTPGNGWGLGWCVIREPQGVTAALSPGTFGHGGAFGTQGWVDPKAQTIYVLMIQRTKFGSGDASDIRGEFHRLGAEMLKK